MVNKAVASWLAPELHDKHNVFKLGGGISASALTEFYPMPIAENGTSF